MDTGQLRLLMVTPRYFPYVGGVETHVYEVARRLADVGVEVTVLTKRLSRFRFRSRLRLSRNSATAKVKMRQATIRTHLRGRMFRFYFREFYPSFEHL